MGAEMSRPLLAAVISALAFAGCASRAVDVKPVPANPAEFMAWDCTRIDDESDSVQYRAAEVAYAVDERVGNNIVALGIGVTIFWPAMIAMRPDGLEAAELGQLKGRYEALRGAASAKGCPPPTLDLPAARAAAMPIVVGERLVYEDRVAGRGTQGEWALRVVALRRDEAEFRLEQPDADPTVWRQDVAGNVTSAPAGALAWQRLLRRELELGQVLAGDFTIVGDPMARARVRGQVVAVGPQTLAGRHFDAAVIDLFGDAQRGDFSTRLDGALVVDRHSGVLLRLDLRSAMNEYNLQRRLARVEAAAP
jgi:hypothetical protein